MLQVISTKLKLALMFCKVPKMERLKVYSILPSSSTRKLPVFRTSAFLPSRLLTVDLTILAFFVASYADGIPATGEVSLLAVL